MIVTYLGVINEEDGDEEDYGEAHDYEDPLLIKHNQKGNQ
jgi:hypothetical protein